MASTNRQVTPGLQSKVALVVACGLASIVAITWLSLMTALPPPVGHDVLAATVRPQHPASLGLCVGAVGTERRCNSTPILASRDFARVRGEALRFASCMAVRGAPVGTPHVFRRSGGLGVSFTHYDIHLPKFNIAYQSCRRLLPSIG